MGKSWRAKRRGNKPKWVDEAPSKSIQKLEEVQDTFVEQAGFGIAVAMSLHEINKITANFYTGISSLIKKENLIKLN